MIGLTAVSLLQPLKMSLDMRDGDGDGERKKSENNLSSAGHVSVVVFREGDSTTSVTHPSKEVSSEPMSVRPSASSIRNQPEGTVIAVLERSSRFHGDSALRETTCPQVSIREIQLHQYVLACAS